MAQRLPYFPGGALATPFHIVTAMALWQLPEGLLVDGKETGYPKGKRDAFLKDVCAFANASGGVIVLGMKEEPNGRWTAVGLASALDQRRQLIAWLSHLEPPGVPDISIELVPYAGKDFLVVQVPRARRRPACYADSSDHRCQFWIREGEGARPLALSELAGMFRTQHHRHDRWQRMAHALIRRFDEASSTLRDITIQLVVGKASPDDLHFLTRSHEIHRPVFWRGAAMSDPIVLPYDQDLCRAFGRIPESWVTLGEEGDPQFIRLPGNSMSLGLAGGTATALQDLLRLFHDAGTTFSQLMDADDACRRTASYLHGRRLEPECSWALFIGLEAARLPQDDPLRARIRSWYHGYDFDYESVLADDFHTLLGHVVTLADVREAALRRLRIDFQGDPCLLSSLVLLDLLHRDVL